ncbi:MAG TPA: hypothetical protein VMN57_00950 [Anaerolineales bacterium]|nr:hypothetical protein [Anaerolineales bacterium]
MGDDSIFRNPKKQIYLVTFVFIVWYGILVFKTGGLSLDDIFITILAIMFGLYRRLGLLQGDIGARDLIPENMQAILRDGWVFFFVLLGGLIFYAQFVLPLHNTRERWEAFTRLVLYVLRRHGPAISIVDGAPKHSTAELERRGRGVIMLDTASAAVLRTPTRFTRAVGPGTVFTGKNETIANAFSLHLQSKSLGPRGGEDPFAEQDEDETDQEYKMRGERRWETRGTTRDGVEVVPRIVTIFKLDNEPNEGQTQFGYNGATIWKANGREGIDPQKATDTHQRRVRWDWLPAFMAAELWREYLSKFMLNDLFMRPNQVVEETGLQKIERFVQTRLTEPRVEHLNEFGKPSGRGKMTSPEYMRMRERGLRVKQVVITNLQFPPEFEARLLGQWRDRWQDQARTTEMTTQQLRSRKRMEGEETALKEFADYASRLLGDHLIHNAPDPSLAPDLSQSLELLVRGTHDQTVMDDYLRPLITSEKQDLVDLIEWIRRY